MVLHRPVELAGGFEQLHLRSGLVLVATLCSHWRIPDALLSCHRYGEILPPVQSNLATCQIQRSAAARRFRSEQTGSKVRIARDSPGTMCWTRNSDEPRLPRAA